MILIDEAPKWAFRCDVLRPTSDFSDLLKVVSCHYELYEKGARYMSPCISRQVGSQMPFVGPDREQIKNALGKARAVIHPVTYHSYVSELHDFASRTKGKRQLITPHPSTHHSAQFASGTFSIEKCQAVKLQKSKGITPLHKFNVFGASVPFYVEGLKINADHISFIIIRPRLGKLGTSSAVNWEVLGFRQKFQYLIDHVDSTVNPRFTGNIR